MRPCLLPSWERHSAWDWVSGELEIQAPSLALRGQGVYRGDLGSTPGLQVPGGDCPG